MYEVLTKLNTKKANGPNSISNLVLYNTAHVLTPSFDVYEVLTKLNTEKANGPHNISNLVLYNTAHVLTPSLKKLINKSLCLMEYPSQPRWLSGLRRSRVHSMMIARRSLCPEKLGSNPGQGSKGINFSGWHSLDMSVTDHYCDKETLNSNKPNQPNQT